MKSFGISDHGNISGCIKHWKACRKSEIKPILGVELYLCFQSSSIKNAHNRKNTHQVVWCKNHDGWRDLLKLVSYTNHPDNFYYVPRIHPWNTTSKDNKAVYGLEHFAANGNLMSFSGHQGSMLSDNLFSELFDITAAERKDNINKAYNSIKTKDPNDYKPFLKDNWLESTCELALKLEKMFGKGNFFIELQNEFYPVDIIPCTIHPLIVDCLREVSKETGILSLASSDPHYPTKEHAQDQRMLIAIQMNKTEKEIQKILDSDEDHNLLTFFGNDSFYIHSYNEMAKKFTTEELENTNKVSDQVEEFDLSHKPIIPNIEIPEIDMSRLPNIPEVQTESDKYLLHLCIQGATDKRPWESTEFTKNDYWDRIKEELAVICKYNLSPYFLLVWDICKAMDNRPKTHTFNWQRSGPKAPVTRGIARGCLSGDEEIILDNGEIKSLKDVAIGDKVLCKDGSCHFVQNTMKYDCTEELLQIKSIYAADSCVTLTKDHKIFAIKRQIENRYQRRERANRSVKIRKYTPVTYDDAKWIRADKLEKNDLVFIPQPKVRKNDLSLDVDLAKYCTEDKFTYDDRYVYHHVKNVLCNVDNDIKKIDRFLSIDHKWLTILGLFTGDGFTINQKESIGFAFHEYETATINKVKELFTNIGCDISIEKHKTAKLVQIIIRNGIIKRFFQDLFNNYHSSVDKHVPRFVFNCSQRERMDFLYGYFLSDGHKRKHRITYSTISRTLAYQVRYLLMTCGYLSSILSEKRVDEREQFKNTKTSYSISFNINNKTTKSTKYIDDVGWFVPITDISICQSKSRVVYDLTIENQHNYCTTSFLVHNSAAGCLVSYLIDITGVDPLAYNLLFTRFLNAGRFTDTHVELPDIDLDISAKDREWVFDYVKDKYGVDNVSKMGTFGTIKGRAAIKDITRVKGISYDEANQMSKHIPDEAAISDQLQEAKDDGNEDYKIINWALDHSKEFQEFYQNDEYKVAIDQAIRVEGTYKSRGKHPAGVIILNEPIQNRFPLSLDTHGKELVIGFDMKDIELLGGIKIDLLGISLLDKLKLCQDLVNVE